MLRNYRVKHVVAGMAHITGSGLPGNLPRAFGSHLNAKVNPRTWSAAPIFDFLRRHGQVPEAEMWDVFNMGVGFTMIVRPAFADSIIEQLKRQGETVSVIGKMVKGTGRVVMG